MQKNKKKDFLEKWWPFYFSKKNFEQIFFQNLRGQKSKIGCLYGSYLVFLKDWAEVSLNIENGVTIIWSVKSVGLKNLPFLKFRKKIANFGALETNVDN